MENAKNKLDALSHIDFNRHYLQKNLNYREKISALGWFWRLITSKADQTREEIKLPEAAENLAQFIEKNGREFKKAEKSSQLTSLKGKLVHFQGSHEKYQTIFNRAIYHIDQILKDPPSSIPKRSETQENLANRLAQLESSLAAYQGEDVISFVDKQAPGIQTKLQKDSQLIGRYNRSINQAIMAAHERKVGRSVALQINQVVCERGGESIFEGLEKRSAQTQAFMIEVAEHLFEVIQELKDAAVFIKTEMNIDLPSSFLNSLLATYCQEKNSLINPTLKLADGRQALKEAQKEGVVGDWVDRKIQEHLRKEMKHTAVHTHLVHIRRSMKKFVRSVGYKVPGSVQKAVIKSYVKQLSKWMSGVPEAQLAQKLKERKKLFVKALPTVLANQMPNSSIDELELKWYVANMAYRTIHAQQNADPSRVLGEGLCFHSALAVCMYKSHHPNTCDEELEEYLLKRAGEADETVPAPSRYFSAKDRFYQASYEMAIKRGDHAVVEASPQAMRDYGIKEEVFTVPVSSNQTSAQRAEMVVNHLDKKIEAERKLKLKEGALILATQNHAIEIDYHFEKGTYSIWDANGGRYTYPSYELFKTQLALYLTGQDTARVTFNTYSQASARR